MCRRRPVQASGPALCVDERALDMQVFFWVRLVHAGTCRMQRGRKAPKHKQEKQRESVKHNYYATHQDFRAKRFPNLIGHRIHPAWQRPGRNETGSESEPRQALWGHWLTEHLEICGRASVQIP